MNEIKKTAVDYAMSWIRKGAIIFGGGAAIYLFNEGELGVNMTTVMATASPIVVVVITYMFDLFKWVLPKMMLAVVYKKVVGVLGKDNTAYLKQLINNKSPQEIVNELGVFFDDIQDIKGTLKLIRQDQENVM